MSKNKILILDADSLIYIAGNKETLEEAISFLEHRIMGIQDTTKCDKVLGFITNGKCFRTVLKRCGAAAERRPSLRARVLLHRGRLSSDLQHVAPQTAFRVHVVAA